MEPKWLILAFGLLMVLLVVFMKRRPNPNTVYKDIVFTAFIASSVIVGGLFSINVYQIYLFFGLGTLLLSKYTIPRFNDWLETNVKK